MFYKNIDEVRRNKIFESKRDFNYTDTWLSFFKWLMQKIITVEMNCNGIIAQKMLIS